MQNKFIFGGNTDVSYEDLQRRRRYADNLLDGSPGMIRNVGDGLDSASRSIAAALMNKRTDQMENQLRAQFNHKFSSILGI